MNTITSRADVRAAARPRDFLQRAAVSLFFLIMIVVFEIISRKYLSLENIKSIVTQASMLGIIACGMTVVMMTGGADMSVGSVAGLTAICGLWFVVNDGLPLPVGIALGLAAGAAIGFINGLCVSRLGIAPFVATLGTMFLGQGLQYMVSEGGMALSYGFPKEYLFLGTGNVAGVPMPIVVFALIFAVMLFLTESSPVGRYLKATGCNQFAAELSGVKIRKYTLISYVLSALLAGVLGLILGASQQYISPTLGDSFLMDSLIVALLGKALFDERISMQGTLFGALFLRSFENGLSMVGMPVTVLNILKGALLVGILLINLARKRRAERRAT